MRARRGSLVGVSELARAVWEAIGGDAAALERLDAGPFNVVAGALPSSFDVEGFAAAAFATLGLAASEWSGGGAVVVDPAGVPTAVRSEAALRVNGAPPGPVWDPLSRVYAAADGWVRLHGNYAQHRAGIERVFGSVEPEVVAEAIAAQPADAVEAALHRAGGVAAAARTIEAWRAHPHGRTVLDLPLISTTTRSDRVSASVTERPRVLELTRVIAGPTAGRALAWFGADVLRIEAPGHEELQVIVVDFGAGKRSIELDLRAPEGRRVFLDLLAGADVFLHGVRPGALERLGLGAEQRAAVRPGLIDASLSAYGPTGGWAGRRGFDSLMQLSAGLAVAEAAAAGTAPGPGGLPEPRALPCQILDHATGLLLAAATFRALAARSLDGRGRSVVGSLARTAAALAATGGRLLDPAAKATAASPGTVELRGPHGTTQHAPIPVRVGGLEAAGWHLPPPVPGSGTAAWAD
jgi:hypothetical protein